MKFLLINIEVKQPIKTDLSYISGSTIRGAYIQSYINKNNIKEDISLNPKYRESLLTDRIRFFDAYPKVDNLYYSIPTPLCFYAEKSKIKEFVRDKKPIAIINELVDDNIKEGYQRINKSEFSIIDDNSIKLISVKRVEQIHNCKQIDSENIFRYEAIDKNQVFYSIIQCEDDLVNEVEDTLDKQMFYLGKSKSSGYGRSKITIEGVFNYEEIKPKYNVGVDNKSAKLNVFFQSDAIIRDEYGNIQPIIPVEFLEEKLKLEKVELKKSSIISKDVKGYNSMWKCKLPSVTAIKAGSIIEYEYKGDLNKELINQLEIEGVGARKTEGFGRIIINPKFNTSVCSLYEKSEKTKIKEVPLYEESKKFMQNILRNIVLERENEYLTSIVVEALNKNITDTHHTKQVVLDNFPNNQIGRLIKLMQDAIDCEDEQDSKNIIIKFKNELKTKTKEIYSNKSKASLFELPLIDYLEEIVSDKTISEITGTSLSMKYPVLKDIYYDKVNDYRLKLKLSKKLFEYRLRKIDN